MPRSPRPRPQADLHRLRALVVGLALACALPALAWPAAASAQDGSGAIDKSRSDPLGARQGEKFPEPALSQPASPAIASAPPGPQRAGRSLAPTLLALPPTSTPLR